jgi:hypothetical protein
LRRYNIERGASETCLDARCMPTKLAQLPLQNNHCDCGVFVLQYIEEISRRFYEQMEKDKLKQEAEEAEEAKEAKEAEENNEGENEIKEEKSEEEEEEEEEDEDEFTLPIKDKNLFSSETISEKRIKIRDEILELAVKSGLITEEEAEKYRINTSIGDDDEEELDYKETSAATAIVEEAPAQQQQPQATSSEQAKESEQQQVVEEEQCLDDSVQIIN